MVVELLGHDRHAGHEAERGGEVREAEGALDGVSLALGRLPQRPLLDRRRGPDLRRPAHAKVSPVAADSSPSVWSTSITLIAFMPSAAAGLQLMPRSSR